MRSYINPNIFVFTVNSSRKITAVGRNSQLKTKKTHYMMYTKVF